MQIQLTDQKAFIQQGIQAGRFAREEDALQEACPCGKFASAAVLKFWPSIRPPHLSRGARAAA